MGDFIKSVKAYLYDKTVSPLAGAFVISCAVWNFKSLAVLFLSALPVEKRFEFISTALYPGNYDSILKVGVYPLVTALVYIFLYPYPAKWVYSFSRKRQHELQEIKKKIEGEALLTLEESRNIRRLMVDLEIDFDKQIAKKDEVIKRLTEMNSATENSLEVKPGNTSDVSVGDVPNELDPDLAGILQFIAENPGKDSDEIANFFIRENNAGEPMSRARFSLNFGRLSKLSYIRSSIRGLVNITQEGLEALARIGQV